MAHDNYPKGAGLGRDPTPRNPTLIDFEWTMQHGSRAQRREILRQLKMYRRQGVSGAAEAMRSLAEHAHKPESGAHRVWRDDAESGAALEVARGQ